jgi:inhibitor of cysteine peptidase
MIRIDESQNQREVPAKTGDHIELSLPENPTTGYRWELKADGSPVCRPERDSSYQPPEGGVGRGGVRTWAFAVVAAGTAGIELQYRRSFEAGAAPAKTFSVRVRAAQ